MRPHVFQVRTLSPHFVIQPRSRSPFCAVHECAVSCPSLLLSQLCAVSTSWEVGSGHCVNIILATRLLPCISAGERKWPEHNVATTPLSQVLQAMDAKAITRQVQASWDATSATHIDLVQVQARKP